LRSNPQDEKKASGRSYAALWEDHGGKGGETRERGGANKRKFVLFRGGQRQLSLCTNLHASLPLKKRERERERKNPSCPTFVILPQEKEKKGEIQSTTLGAWPISFRRLKEGQSAIARLFAV